MVDGRLEGQAFAYYVQELRNGSRDPYVAYRVYEHCFRMSSEDEDLVRRATVLLVESDPWFLCGNHHFLRTLTTSDVEYLTPRVGTGPAQHAAMLLRAILWYNTRRGDGRKHLERTLEFLEGVPTDQRDALWHEMTVGCYRVLDYDKYKQAWPALLKSIQPEWRGHHLIRFFDDLATHQDWVLYDQLRPAWDRLPPSHYACECHRNALYTNDGLRAVAASNWDAVPGTLEKAAAVRGCPHLNTGSFRLDLVERLLAARKHLAPARTYLERAALAHQSERVSALLKQLDDLETPA